MTALDRAALRPAARERFGLPADGPVLLVFGGSQGARTLNSAVAAALPGLAEAGIGVLHAQGSGGGAAHSSSEVSPLYRPLAYIEEMHLAYAAADAVLCRAGAMTVAEVSAVGLPAVYVPLPHGNGEQALNAAPVVTAGGGVLVPDAELDRGAGADRARSAAGRRRAARGDGCGGAGVRTRRRRRALARLVLELVGAPVGPTS